MLVSSKGIVLHTLRYGEDGIVAEVLTEEEGTVSFLLKVSRSSRATVRHTLFSPLALLDLTWNKRGTSAMQRCRSVQPTVLLPDITRNPYKNAMVLFLSEFLHYATKVETNPRPLFNYISQSLLWLDACPQGFSNFHIVFLLRLARFLGFEPNIEEFAPGKYFDLRAGRFTGTRPLHPDYIRPEQARTLPLLMRMNFGTMHLFRFSGSARSELLAHINTFYRLHLPAFPELKSLSVLRDMFRS